MAIKQSYQIGRADLEGQGSGTLRSRAFGDVYFDPIDGLGESRHVFLGGCDIPNDWRDRERYTVGELGFGSGLNILAAWNAWKEDPHRPRQLHIVSVEGFPLTCMELQGALGSWPELAPQASQLTRAYPDPQPGYHRLSFEGGRVKLTLLLGPALAMLQSLDATIDAWFLDGFAPDRNPEMWQPEIFREVARLSQQGAQLATFTVAGQVRRDLEDAGFTIEKRPGWGRKRETLAGCYTNTTPLAPRQDPWYRPPVALTQTAGDVLVIGSGLAGAATAHAFSKRGYSVKVIEKGESIAPGASSTPAAVLMPRLTADHSTDGLFYATAWQHCLALLQDLETAGHDLNRNTCGSLKVAADDREAARHQRIIETGLVANQLIRRLNKQDTSAQAGVPLTSGGLFFPQGGMLSPTRLCWALLDQAYLIFNRVCAKLERTGTRWVALDEAGKHISDADIVVLANGFGTTHFAQAEWLPLDIRLGQVTSLPSQTAGAALKCVVAGEGYITPAQDDRHIVGSTFDHVSPDVLVSGTLNPTPEADTRNLTLMSQWFPHLLGRRVDSTRSWTGVRCTTPDHLPVAGAIPDYEAYKRDFADLRHGHRWSKYPDAKYHSGLGILTGLGAHGVIAAPLAAELLASQLLGEPGPLPREVANGLHPGRFIVRNLKRRTV